jgi:imidazolonepropionase-like amidohydrolase/Tol biopolymer transport system component
MSILRMIPGLALPAFLLSVNLVQAAPGSAEAPPTTPTTPATSKKWDVNHPPGPVQTVNIDTTSGTWISVDVSPDGKELVFDLLGDLYLLPIGGGEAKALTHSMAWDMQPRFSPDGKSIAYISDAAGGDNIWVMQKDGSAAHAISHETYRLLYNPVWHPNGQYVAARKHFSGTRSLGSGEIWLYHTGGSGAGVQLNEKPNWQKDLGEPAFSPDGRYLYYSQDTTPGPQFEYNRDSHGQIYQILRRDLQEGKTRPLVGGPGGAIAPTPSPDGKYLAFVRRVSGQSTLFLKDLKTGVENAAWPELERDLQESWAVQGVYPGYAWLPGSRELVIWAKGGLWRLDPFSHQAKVIPFHVKDSREIRPAVRFAQAVAPEQFDVKQLRWANVAAQGDKVVYSALGYLYARPLPQGQARRLTSQTQHFEFYPQFSRDGKRVVFSTWSDADGGSVRVLDLTSGKETVISRERGKYLEPAFSPDGKQVAFVKARGGYLTTPWYGLDTGVYLAASDGSSAPQLISEEGRAPQFGPASAQALGQPALYVTRSQFTGEVDFHTDLIKIDLHSRAEQVIAKSEFATSYVLSPDASHLAFTERFHAFVSPLPLAGKTINFGKGGEALPLKQFDVHAGEYLHWSGDGKTLHYMLGDQLFSQPIGNSFAYTPPPAPAQGSAAAAPAAAGTPAAGSPAAPPGIRIGLTVPAATPQGKIVISGARIISMKGDEIIENGKIIIENNRIKAIGNSSEIASPSDAVAIDARGKTIIPGLIDVHWHGGMGEDGLIPQQSWINYASLAFGVTTIHDPSNQTAQIFGHSEMQRAGLVVGPRIFSTGTILYGAKGNFAAPVDSLDDALNHLKRQQAAGAFSVKSYNQPRREQRQQILEAARQTGMMVVPEGGALFQHNMNMVIDGHTGIEHALPLANVYDDVKQLWSQTAVGYTPTLGVGYGGLDGEHYWYAYSNVWQHPLLTRFVPKSLLEARSVRRELAPEADYNVFDIAKTATALQRRGVNVNLGAHGQREGLAAHWEMWTLFKGGMTPLEAIRSATLNGAKYLGMEKDIGSLEPGKLADLVIIEGDLLQNFLQSDRISQVMQNGRLYDSNLDQVAPSHKKRQPFFFEGGQATGLPVEQEQQHGHRD